MYAAYKHFDKVLFSENDAAARSAVRSLLKQSPVKAFPAPNKYGVDLFIYRNEVHVGYIETEIKRGWVNREYPFSDVRFPYRKLKFLDLDKPTVFVMFNKTCEFHLAVMAQDVAKSPIVQVNNNQMRNEPFFAVPLDKVKWNWLATW